MAECRKFANKQKEKTRDKGKQGEKDNSNVRAEIIVQRMSSDVSGINNKNTHASVHVNMIHL